jgi:uncharacterized protein (TIGR02996 family)
VTPYDHPELHRLLAGILADPGEDRPRLAWADRLAELGDGDRAAQERAEFVRVQVELAASRRRWPGGVVPWKPLARRETLGRRERELLEANLCEWVWRPAGARMVCHLSGDAPGEVNVGLYRPVEMDHRQTFRRGFVESVTMPAADLAHLDAVLKVQPVTRVTLTTGPTLLVRAAGRRVGVATVEVGGAASVRVRECPGKEAPAGEGPAGPDRVAWGLGRLWPGIAWTLPPG